DHALFDFLSGIEARHLLDRTFHSNTIQTAYPRYAELPFAVPNPRPERSWRSDVSFALNVMRYSLGNASRPVVNLGYLGPRVVRCMLDRSYASEIRWIGLRLVYCLQLHNLEDEPLPNLRAA